MWGVSCDESLCSGPLVLGNPGDMRSRSKEEGKRLCSDCGHTLPFTHWPHYWRFFSAVYVRLKTLRREPQKVGQINGRVFSGFTRVFYIQGCFYELSEETYGYCWPSSSDQVVVDQTFFNVSFSFNLPGCVFYKTVIIKKVLMIL